MRWQSQHNSWHLIEQLLIISSYIHAFRSYRNAQLQSNMLTRPKSVLIFSKENILFLLIYGRSLQLQLSSEREKILTRLALKISHGCSISLNIVYSKDKQFDFREENTLKTRHYEKIIGHCNILSLIIFLQLHLVLFN